MINVLTVIFPFSLLCLFSFRISNKKLVSLKIWLKDNGLTPVVLKSGGISRTRRVLSPDDITRAVKFILNYAENFAVFLPGRIPGFKRSDLRLLPTSSTKASVYRLYETAMKEGVYYRLNVSVVAWNELLIFLTSGFMKNKVKC